MIKIRIDVDYPYPSRAQSILCTALKIKLNKDYLKNSKILARMINESKEEVRAYWFFTPQTIPDRELLRMLNPSKHEVALHVANKPYEELEALEEATGRKVHYWTVHGTARLFARLIWRRKIWEGRATIPKDFPLQSFYDYPTIGLDRVAYSKTLQQAIELAKEAIKKGQVLHIHPEWLFQRGTLNHRGPYYRILRIILQVDLEIEALVIRKKCLFKIANNPNEYEKDVFPNDQFLKKLADYGIDVFTFVERSWCCKLQNQPKWLRTQDNVALLPIKTYKDWWEAIGKKTRNMVRKAGKNGITIRTVEPSENLAEGIWRIYNETPIRQERPFTHYGMPQSIVNSLVMNASNSTFIGAFFGGELAGFIQLVEGDKIALVAQILSLQRLWDKAVNNALLAKSVELAAEKKIPWLMYGRMGNHPSLDNFKTNHGFIRFTLKRFYVPTTRKGTIIAELGLQKEAKDALPQPIRNQFIPIFNWISRTKLKTRRKIRARTQKAAI
jgi:hypothetical protein